MNKYPKIEITMYANSHGYTIQTQKNAKWLRTRMPQIMKTQVMIADELYLAPLRQAVSICLT